MTGSRPTRMRIPLLLAVGAVLAAALVAILLNREKTDELGRTALMQAAAAGDAARIESLVKEGARLNAQVETNELRRFLAFFRIIGPVERRNVGWTPLMFACAGGHAAAVRQLVGAGVDVNLGDRFGQTALLIATRANYPEIVRELAQGRAAVNQRGGDDGRTPLMVAVEAGGIESLRILLEAGADVKASAADGSTPLITAARLGALDAVQLLLGAGADPLARDRSMNRTALDWALAERYSEIARLLRASEPAEGQTEARDLLQAVTDGDHEAVRKALAAGANLSLKNQHGDTALIVAARKGDLTSIQSLIAAGADPNQIDQIQKTPLYAAAQWGHLDVVRELIRAGARVRDESEAAVTIAAQEGRAEVVRLLIAAGADVNWGSGQPLREACGQGHYEIVVALLQAGANPNLSDGAGTTALMRAAADGKLTVARSLVSSGGDVNAANSSGTTALMMAALNGHQEVVRLLIESGADVTVRDINGKAAYDYAEQMERMEVVRILREAGAR